MAIFSFDITFSSHALLRQGITEARLLDGSRFHRTFVDADDAHTAELTAIDMSRRVMSRYIDDVMVTGCYPRF